MFNIFYLKDTEYSHLPSHITFFCQIIINCQKKGYKWKRNRKYMNYFGHATCIMQIRVHAAHPHRHTLVVNMIGLMKRYINSEYTSSVQKNVDADGDEDRRSTLASGGTIENYVENCLSNKSIFYAFHLSSPEPLVRFGRLVWFECVKASSHSAIVHVCGAQENSKNVLCLVADAVCISIAFSFLASV